MSGKTMCDIEDDVKDALRAFRFRKSQKNAALILKVDREKQKICIDEQMEDIKIDDLQEIIPCHQPRYIVYSYKMEHADGRISYPMCFIFYTPRDIQMELQVIYAGMKLALQREAELTRVYEVRELEELTEDWLKEKLSR
ncbi:glia maturation factor beta isoform X1 [Orussus abietinus]|uniref:glia maturation factor beta isoform X1 n=1 Tax=Orussus abietinus TaxID=222816 RepID=UPI0006256508|nr:glia maturation factor beta isoform X1 [Orussus abietinus]XP_012286318.1 glia maturation factor beta isoform X1 [Orussus abietinus]XP_012286319.1 glia maturation factor beta isoform X1 [Orussus abietinus]XP_012286320.1 glia maturation factor beta isoform X1 [Orussus abietinus]XP_012286321.1 glia maturation factor beta isoform X1 [Orussus abietinus]XP_023288055.1 glia maturation factor beta isoform X1 [Orussus abietinus]